LNRLRFAAAGRASNLPDDVLVGPAVLETPALMMN
jgi:hypothetical protein